MAFPLLQSVRRYPAAWFYSCWLLLNLVQSCGTELLDDEAYYWVYSRYLDWGYFDHPPMIAVLIKAGYAIFKSELGVRLFITIMNAGTLFLVQKMLLKKNDKLFYAIALSIGVIQIGGILAVPDIPLAFFTALFFWQYRRFLDAMTTKNSLLLGLIMALMLYSKYHGVLIILFTFMGNRKLFFYWQAWVAAIFGAILFGPHLWWQWTHEFPSVAYHLQERNAPAYHLTYTTDYIIGQLLLAGPLIGWLLFYAGFSFRNREPFVRSLYYCMAGFYIFFLASSFKGRVEANWTVPALVPLIILGHAWLSDSARLTGLVYKLMIPSLLMVMVVRVYLFTDIPSLTSKFNDEMHNNKSWADTIKQHAGGLPVLFINSYQRPSKYWFYTGDSCFGLNTTLYRRNNFNFWPIEKEFQGKTLYAVDGLMGRFENPTHLETTKGATWAKTIYGFSSNSFLRFQAEGYSIEINNRKLQPIIARIYPDTAGSRLLARSQTTTAVLDIYLMDSLAQRVPLEFKYSSGKWIGTAAVTIQLPTGRYRGKIGLPTSLPGFFSQNSASIPLRVTGNR